MTFFSERKCLDAISYHKKKAFYVFKLLLFSFASKLHVPIPKFNMKNGRSKQGFHIPSASPWLALKVQSVCLRSVSL